MFDAFQNKLTEIIDSNAPYVTLSKKLSDPLIPGGNKVVAHT